MSSLWTDMLFLHGHIADPELARRLAQPAPPEQAPPPRPNASRPQPTKHRATFYLAASMRRSLSIG
jgi:hypothetical protein